MSSPSYQTITKRPRDCFSCRVVSGSGLIGVSAFLIYQSWKRRGYEKLTITTIASVVGGLGIARLLNLPPFDTAFLHTPKKSE